MDTDEPELQSRSLHERIQDLLGSPPLRSDKDLCDLVERRLPVAAVKALMNDGYTASEIFRLVMPRRTFNHRSEKGERLTREESDRVVRIARITALAEQVFGDAEKAARWLRKSKHRLDKRAPLDLLDTEAGGRLIEDWLRQIDHGMAA